MNIFYSEMVVGAKNLLRFIMNRLFVEGVLVTCQCFQFFFKFDQNISARKPAIDSIFLPPYIFVTAAHCYPDRNMKRQYHCSLGAIQEQFYMQQNNVYEY